MNLERQMAEDRALRDAALALFKSDLDLIRADLHERGVGARLADRIGDSAMDIADEAVDYADENRGTVAAAMAALVLWFARGPIFAALLSLFGGDEEEEPEHAANRSRKRKH
jgi:hypothetical protein